MKRPHNSGVRPPAHAFCFASIASTPLTRKKLSPSKNPRCIDVCPVHIDAAHHDIGQVSLDKPGASKGRADELRSLQVVGPGEGCDDFCLSSALLPLAHVNR
jgi:hypothetical protein